MEQAEMGAPATASAIPPCYLADRARIALVAQSYAPLLGHALVDMRGDVVAALWDAPCVVLAHDTRPDPIFFFANRAALAAFETSAEAVVAMPSRLSAEPAQRTARQALLDRVARDGFIEDYAGVRISARGRRFRVSRAVVWNLIDSAGACHGQAATFAAPDLSAAQS
jgi:hypothetical protein